MHPGIILKVDPEEVVIAVIDVKKSSIKTKPGEKVGT